MTSRSRGVFLTEDTLARLLRAAVAESITVGAQKARTPSILSGTVEAVNYDELDVAWIRMDEEAGTGDPAQSSNFEEPGVIPTTRLGETYTDEVVRTTFDGASGAASIRTSAPNQIILPYGTEIGQRIILDGNTGTIQFISENDELVGYLDPTRWFIGEPGAAQAQLDPLSGLRLRDSTDNLRVQLSAPEGLVIREPTAGISGLLANHDGVIVLDPDTGDRISITSGTTSAVPTPHWISTTATSPGTSHSTPANTTFGPDDIDLRFTAASAASDLGAQSYTPPVNWTERSDVNSTGSGITLASSFATRDPATAVPAAASFTNTSAGFTRQNGHSIIVAGGGGVSPAFRAAAVGTVVVSTARTITFNIDYPAGTVAGDLLVAGVSIASSNVPVGWTVPNGWKQLGVQVAGIGTTHILGSGIWYRTAPVSPPASEAVSINMAASGGVTKVQATAVGISDPYGYPAGLDIRRNNRSMPRGLVGEKIETTITTAWTDAQLPQNVLQLNNVEIKAGRKYDVVVNIPSYLFEALSNTCRVSMDVERDAGGGYAAPAGGLVFDRQLSAAGSERNSISASLSFGVTTDEVSNWRVNIRNVTTGAGYTIQLRSAVGSSQRSLRIIDVGGEF